jgi:hypothetical protein
MSACFVNEDDSVTFTKESENVVLNEPFKKVNFKLQLTDFERINELELLVQSLHNKIESVHELLSRLIETNVILKRGTVPTYEASAVANSNLEINSNTSNSNVGTKVTLLKTGNKIVIKGKTFDVKDELKRRFSATWDTGLKSWVVLDSHETALIEFLNEQSFIVV